MAKSSEVPAMAGLVDEQKAPSSTAPAAGDAPRKLIVTNKNVVYPVPVLDDEGKLLMETSKFNGRDKKHGVYDHTTLVAGKPTWVPEKVADYMIKQGHARPSDAIIDDEVIIGNPLAHEPWMKTGANKTDPVNGLPLDQADLLN